jgi:hypothetical protein
LMLEPRIYKVVVLYQKQGMKETGTLYVLAFSAEEAEKRATDAMQMIAGPNRRSIAMEYLVDRTVNWVAITGFDNVVSEG